MLGEINLKFIEQIAALINAVLKVLIKKKYGSVSHTLKITGRKEVHGTLLVERGRADQGLLTARVVVVI